MYEEKDIGSVFSSSFLAYFLIYSDNLSRTEFTTLDNDAVNYILKSYNHVEYLNAEETSLTYPYLYLVFQT